MALVNFLDGHLAWTKSSVSLVIGEGGFLGTDAPAVNNWVDRNFLSLACVCSQHSFWFCGSLWFLLSVLMPVADAVATPVEPPGQWNWGSGRWRAQGVLCWDQEPRAWSERGVDLGSSDTGTVWPSFGLDELIALLTKISHFTDLPLTFTHPVQWVCFYVFKKM